MTGSAALPTAVIAQLRRELDLGQRDIRDLLPGMTVRVDLPARPDGSWQRWEGQLTEEDLRALRGVISLWDAYRLANRRGCSINVDLTPDAGLGNGRSERSLRVSRNLVNGHVAVQQGGTADWIFVRPEQAKRTTVTRA